LPDKRIVVLIGRRHRDDSPELGSLDKLFDLETNHLKVQTFSKAKE